MTAIAVLSLRLDFDKQGSWKRCNCTKTTSAPGFLKNLISSFSVNSATMGKNAFGLWISTQTSWSYRPALKTNTGTNRWLVGFMVSLSKTNYDAKKIRNGDVIKMGRVRRTFSESIPSRHSERMRTQGNSIPWKIPSKPIQQMPRLKHFAD